MSVVDSIQKEQPKSLEEALFRELKRPATFLEFFFAALKNHPGGSIIEAHSHTYGSISIYNNAVKGMKDIVAEKSGKLEAESKEFKEAQAAWFSNYRALLVVQSSLLQLHNIRSPNWNLMMKERDQFGVLLSKEDYERFQEKYGKDWDTKKMTDAERKEWLAKEGEKFDMKILKEEEIPDTDKKGKKVNLSSVEEVEEALEQMPALTSVNQ
jgi:hypothetical protein